MLQVRSLGSWAGAWQHLRSDIAADKLACTGKGHLAVLESVVETLRSTAKDKTGVDTGDFKDLTLVTLTWSRFLKDVLNAQTSGGETALMLACQNGCVLSPSLQSCLVKRGLQP